ncbi:hypothetical protein JVU11DRAFT_11488 [Chiua virens]|nr:hypothetical protein JVU11DRAFT_11488 [Chiua virens]
MATIRASALPTLTSPQLSELPGWTPGSARYRAYNAVLQAEAYSLQSLDEARTLKRAKERSTAVKEAERKLVTIRVAGYLLLEFERQSEFFGFTPSAPLNEWLISPHQSSHSNQHDVIIENGTLICDNFIRAFRSSIVQYPPPSSHPSRASFDTLQDMIKDAMEATGDKFTTSRKRVLARDGYRCVVTGIYDESSLAKFNSVAEVLMATLEVAHIFNESTTQGINPAVDRDSGDDRKYNKTYHAASAMAILRTFGFSKFASKFEVPGGVHEVWNLLTLGHDVHSLFDHLKMWFEYTDKPHRYKVCTSHGKYDKYIQHLFAGHDRQVDGAPMFVEFDSDYMQAPPPDPFLLTLHATCARVAHMSGAAEVFDRVDRDMEESKVLALDGSSSSLLVHLLSPFSVIPGVA